MTLQAENKIQQLERKIADLEKRLAEQENKKPFIQQLKENILNFSGIFRVIGGNVISGDYKEGESGWALKGSGDIEANDGVFRGRLEASEGYFSGDVEGATFTGTNFSGINIEASNITGTNITGGDIDGVNLTGSTITGGDIDGVNLTGSTITGGVVSTSTGDDRVEINETSNSLIVYKDDNERIAIGEGVLTFLTPTGTGAGEIVGLVTQSLAFNTSGAADYIMTPSYLYATDEQDLGSTSERFGTIYLTGSPNVSSSITVKENINKLDYGLNTILKLNPVSFNKKGKTKKEIGFIAEEIKDNIPEISDGKSYTPEQIIPILVKAIQELYKNK